MQQDARAVTVGHKWIGLNVRYKSGIWKVKSAHRRADQPFGTVLLTLTKGLATQVAVTEKECELLKD